MRFKGWEGTAVLFDLDGVLVDSTAAVERAWRGWADQHGFLYEDVIVHAHGRRTAETIAAVAPHLDARAEALALEDDEVTRAAEIAPLPGSNALLRQLVAGSWAIVTSGPRRLAEARIKACDFPKPGALVTGDDVAIGKPHPEGYIKAAQSLGVAAADCIVFEDAPAGIEAARASGAVVIALTTTYGVADLVEADSHIDTLAQVSATLRPNGTVVLHAAQES
jgi:mannitol-1-/sugar-/sorbitol-6-phosphatase